METLVAVGIVGVVFLSLYAGIASGFYSIRIARENLRATQIMLEKMEVIRVLTWDQLNAPGFIPAKFTNFYDPNPVGNSGTGPRYTGSITTTNVTMGTAYQDNLRLVKVQVQWTSCGQDHFRDMTTYCSKYGIQNYQIKK
jgi:hypothetical protein